MAKRTKEAQQQETDDQATSVGALEIPTEPDTSAQSITAGILAELGDEPLVKPKAGRPKKQPKVEQTDDDDDSAPPERLLPQEEEEVGEDESDPEQPEAKEGDDEPEPTELDDQLAALAEETGVEPQLLEGMASVDEAQRFVDRMFQVFYRQGEAQTQQNGQAQSGRAEHREAIPAAPQNGAVQTKATEALELDLSAYDDDEPIKAHLTKLIERDKAREARLAALESERDRGRDEEFRRVQQQVAYQFQNEFFTLAPELFGSEKKQDPRQVQRMRKAFAVADTLIRGYASRREPLPPVKAIAKWAVNAEFAEDLTQKQILNKRAKVSDRQARRSVGAPAKVSRSPSSSAPSAKVFEGPMNEDPDILSAVKSSLGRSRA